MAALEAMQARRNEAYAQAQNEAIRLAQLAASEGEEYDPGDDFLPASAYGEFVFSGPDLLRVLDRRNRVTRAWNHSKRPPYRSESRLESKILTENGRMHTLKPRIEPKNGHMPPISPSSPRLAQRLRVSASNVAPKLLRLPAHKCNQIRELTASVGEV